MLRSKAEWIEGSEKNSKYFANLEKKHSENKTITRLNINGQTITNNNEILHEENKYYQKLYTNKELQTSNYPFFPIIIVF